MASDSGGGGRQQDLSASQVLALLPTSWRSQLAHARWVPVSSDSGASVWQISNAGSRVFLKIGLGRRCAEAIREEVERTAWLHSQGVHVAPILSAAKDSEVAAILFAALEGRALDCANVPASIIIPALGRAFLDLHSIPVERCPFDEEIQTRLERAEHAIAAGEIDPSQFDPRNSGKAPENLFAEILSDVPPEHLVVVHGDATFSNIVIDAQQRIGFLDCGSCGKADAYTDLALLASEIEERYGKEWAARFCRAYGLSEWDPRRAKFYLDLYEFF